MPGGWAGVAVPIRADSRRRLSPHRFRGRTNNMGKGNAGSGRPAGRWHSKDRGDLTEMQFMVAAAGRGFVVAKPYGDNKRYDLIVDVGRRMWRVQVKLSGARHHRGFAVRSSWRTSKQQMPYTPSQVDFLAVMIDGKRIWYVIPVRALAGRLTIHLYPFGSRRGSRNGFEKYRGAWSLLTGGKPAAGKGRKKRGSGGPVPAKKGRKTRSRIRP